MLRYDQVSLSLWKSGAYRAASFDLDSGRGALVEHDGGGTMRLVGVTADSFEETIATRRAVRGGVLLRVSTLRGRGDGRLEWRWQVVRPGLRRDEVLSADAEGKVSFRQTDRRADRTTTFHATGPGRYQGVTINRDGERRWTSQWKRDDSGRMTGSFTGPTGEPAGEMTIPDREQRGAGEAVVWTGPDSKGSVAYGEGARLVSAVVGTSDGTTYTRHEGEGHFVETGTNQDSSWIRTTVPGKDEGDSVWVEWGTEKGYGAASGTTSEYTTHGVSHADGSSSFDRTDVNPTTGDEERTFGGQDSAGNGSVSSRIEHADGSVTVITRTVDKNGNGTEHVTIVDAQGNVLDDGTSIVTAGVTLPPGASTGGPGLSPPGGTSPSTPTTAPEEPEEPEAPDDPDDPDEPDEPDDPDDSDDADDPDDPDSPDDGDDSGRGNDEGTDNDGRPGIPWGKIGNRGGDFGDLFAGLRRLGSGGGDDDEATGRDRINQWRDSLGREIRGVVSGGSGAGGGGADETGWGNGGEGFRGVPLVSGGFAPPPAAADESGWGDLNDPRALVALVESFATAAAGLARSGNLTAVLKR